MESRETTDLTQARDSLQIALGVYLDACLRLENQPSNSHNASRVISDELSTIDSGQYKRMIQHAKLALSRAQNRDPFLVPISRLPPEILARIFTSIQTCCARDLLNPHQDPRQPYWDHFVLSWVCSHWRDIAISSCNMWSHIDIVLSHPLSQSILSRAQVSGIRAKPAALAVHVEDKPTWEHSNEDGDGLAHFFSSYGGRTQSLELRCFYEKRECRQSMQMFFSSATAGVLKQLVLIDKGADCNRCNFLVPAGSGPSITSSAIGRYTLYGLDVTLKEYEDLMLSLTRLKLSAVYPYWTSQAYRGLIELQLIPGRGVGFDNMSRNAIISDLQLAEILRASPELRVFHFGLCVQTVPKSTPHPAYMKDLEVFRLEYMDTDDQQAVLRLINPGQKPFHMIWGAQIHFGAPPLSSQSQFTRFFLRSHLTRLSIKGMMSEFHFFQLLPLLPRLQFLALSQFIINITGELKDQELDTQGTLQRLHLLRCEVYPGSLQLLIKMVFIQRITSSYCQYDYEDLDIISSLVEHVDSEGGFGEGGWDELS
ncbi:unnamed protein product [Rhizoctonia solani]|uniref:F-box domain-containing protein n=1 Tax=Rhizoctonia solani TaxID=456999 RepID=A0A8H2ZZB8_9AGAM|nr:unnamed protein product [Rhizoctonia solani]